MMALCAIAGYLLLASLRPASAEPFVIGELNCQGGGDWYSAPFSLRNLIVHALTH